MGLAGIKAINAGADGEDCVITFHADEFDSFRCFRRSVVFGYSILVGSRNRNQGGSIHGYGDFQFDVSIMLLPPHRYPSFDGFLRSFGKG